MWKKMKITILVVLVAHCGVMVYGNYRYYHSGYYRHALAHHRYGRCCRDWGSDRDYNRDWEEPVIEREEINKYAVCEVEPNPSKQSMNDSVTGVVHLKQRGEDGRTMIYIQLKGFNTKDQNIYHGFHIHAYGSIRAGCEGAGAHYNPEGVLHGSPLNGRDNRHVGDLGNIMESSDGTVITHFSEDLVVLSGPQSVMGRTIVVHAKKDDLGRGGDEESTKTGNAGGRIACCVISAADGKFWGAN